MIATPTTTAHAAAPRSPRRPAGVLMLRWLARAASLVSIGLLALFAFGTNEDSILHAAPREWLLLACFPAAVVVGLGIAWWRELAGAAIALLGLAAFYAIVAARQGAPHALSMGVAFVVFTLPAGLFLIAGLLARRSGVAGR